MIFRAWGFFITVCVNAEFLRGVVLLCIAAQVQIFSPAQLMVWHLCQKIKR